MTLPAFLCLRTHQLHIRQRFVLPSLVLLWCDKCEVFR